MKKYNYINIVKDRTVLDMADLAAIRLSGTGQYLIQKSRGKDLVGCVISGNDFIQDIIIEYKRPLVFCEEYLEYE